MHSKRAQRRIWPRSQQKGRAIPCALEQPEESAGAGTVAGKVGQGREGGMGQKREEQSGHRMGNVGTRLALVPLLAQV